MPVGEAGTAGLIGYLGKATRFGREILAPVESNGAIPVNIQDQHTKALDIPFIQNLTPTTLSVKANPDDRTVTVTSTAGFTAGASIILAAAGNFYYGVQIGAVAGNVVTLDTPIDSLFPAGSIIFPGSHHMNVDGSSTTQIFQIGPVGGPAGVSTIELDITRVLGYIEDATTMDDAKFGGGTALTNGIVLRVNNSTLSNVWNIKTNGEIGLLCFDTQYTDKAPSGFYGLRFRNTYAGQAKHGVTLRLQPGQTLQILIQDDLTGLTSFQMMAQGHFVTD